jgi:hypothetical protein
VDTGNSRSSPTGLVFFFGAKKFEFFPPNFESPWNKVLSRRKHFFVGQNGSYKKLRNVLTRRVRRTKVQKDGNFFFRLWSNLETVARLFVFLRERRSLFFYFCARAIFLGGGKYCRSELCNDLCMLPTYVNFGISHLMQTLHMCNAKKVTHAYAPSSYSPNPTNV